jgi:hypothetical protein
MTQDVLDLLRDDDKRRAFGEKGRELAIERYSTEMIIPQYIAFYESVVEKAEAAVA